MDEIEKANEIRGILQEFLTFDYRKIVEERDRCNEKKNNNKKEKKREDSFMEQDDRNDYVPGKAKENKAA